eukprot:UC1_evm1s2088
MAEGQDGSFLRKAHVCVLRGSCLNQAHFRKLRKRLKACGGSRCKADHEDTTHFLCPSGSYEDDIRTTILEHGGCVPEGAAFVTVDWLQDSLRDKTMHRVAAYRIATKRPSESTTTTATAVEAAAAAAAIVIHPDPTWPMSYNPKPLLCQMRARLDSNHNEALTRELGRLEKYYRIMPSRGVYERGQGPNDKRQVAYARAIGALRAAPRAVRSGKEAMERLPFISNRLAKKIDEFLEYGCIGEADELCSEEKYLTLEKLQLVHGAGPSYATKWFEIGIHSLEDLRARYSKGEIELTSDQRDCLPYVERLQEPMTRADAEAFRDFVDSLCRQCGNVGTGTSEYAPGDEGSSTSSAAGAPTSSSTSSRPLPVLETKLCGSYVRGKQNMKDLDLLLRCETGANLEKVRARLLSRLQRAGVLACTFKTPPIKPLGGMSFGGQNGRLLSSESDSSGSQQQQNPEYLWETSSDVKAYIVYRIPGCDKVRRADLIFVPTQQWASMVMGWSGSTMFLRDLQTWAKNMGFVRNNYGLFKKESGQQVDTPTEHEIFKCLHLEYVPPEARNL